MLETADQSPEVSEFLRSTMTGVCAVPVQPKETVPFDSPYVVMAGFGTGAGVIEKAVHVTSVATEVKFLLIESEK